MRLSSFSKSTYYNHWLCQRSCLESRRSCYGLAAGLTGDRMAGGGRSRSGELRGYHKIVWVEVHGVCETRAEAGDQDGGEVV